MRCHVRWVYGRHQHARVRHTCGISTVAADYPDDPAPDFTSVVQSCDQVGADILILTSTANRQHENHILCTQAAGPKPGLEHCYPALVVCASRQFGDVIGGSVRFDVRQLAEVVDSVRRIRGASADAK